MTQRTRRLALLVLGTALVLAPAARPPHDHAGQVEAGPQLVPFHRLASGTEVYNVINFP